MSDGSNTVPVVGSVLESIQLDLRDRLLADPYFSGADGKAIPVLTEVLGDIENQITIAVNQLGICVIIVTPTADVLQTRNAPGPYLDSIELVCRVSEQVTINRGIGGTNKTALSVAEHVLAVLHRHRPVEIYESLYPNNPTLSLSPGPSGLVIYDLLFRTQGGIQYVVPQVASPVITNDGAAVTISCDTPYANIFFTTDGSPPTPRSGIPYSGPFTVSNGATVNAKAWLAGYLASATVSKKISVADSTPPGTAANVRINNGQLQLRCDDTNLWFDLKLEMFNGHPTLAVEGEGVA